MFKLRLEKLVTTNLQQLATKTTLIFLATFIAPYFFSM